MVATAVLSADPIVCRSLGELLQNDVSITLVGVADQPLKLLGLAKKHRIDVVLVHGPLIKQFTDSSFPRDTTPWAAIMDRIDEDCSLMVLSAGASAILSRSATRKEMISAITAVANGFTVFQRSTLGGLIDVDSLPDAYRDKGNNRLSPLTPRELQVLTAMADGASNKVIARRLGISFHTVKFHVAAVLVKLDADSRTEAVMKAAQRGILML
jgi:DNA-binding NarL/FixJ family response regulator